MIISITELTEEALRGIAQQYVEQNIADTEADINFDQWTQQVITMAKQGKLLVEYSEVNQSVNLVSPEKLKEKNLED